jgi:broad specificity phosphatase PhoE
MLHHNEFYLHLIRHGQTETNVLPDVLGQEPDSQLTQHGRWQAQMLHDRLIREDVLFDRAFSSDYDRAKDTANIVIANKIPIVFAPPLREYDAGDWMHASRAETHTMPVVLRMAAMTNAFLPPNGESMHMVERRASQWLEEAILYNKDIQSYASERITPMNIAVFSHGMTIKCLLHYIMGFDQSFTWRLTIENTSITKLYFDDKGWRLITVNDFAHLM